MGVALEEVCLGCPGRVSVASPYEKPSGLNSARSWFVQMCLVKGAAVVPVLCILSLPCGVLCGLDTCGLCLWLCWLPVGLTNGRVQWWGEVGVSSPSKPVTPFQGPPPQSSSQLAPVTALPLIPSAGELFAGPLGPHQSLFGLLGSSSHEFSISGLICFPLGPC